MKYLCLEGGGVLAPGHAGGVDELSRHLDISHIKGFAGTSAGAITAALLACGVCPGQLIEIAHTTPYAAFRPPTLGPVLAYRWLAYRGLYSTKPLQAWLEGKIKENISIPQISFQELFYRRGVTLKVYAANSRTGQTVEFSPDRTPLYPISRAVVHSMTVPNLFIPLDFEGYAMSDGGVCANSPIQAFDQDGPNDETIGFRLDSSEEIGEVLPGPKKRSVFGYNADHVVMMYEQGNKKHLRPADWARTVRIDTRDIPALDFNISEQQVKFLIEQGRKAVRCYFDTRGARRYVGPRR